MILVGHVRIEALGLKGALKVRQPWAGLLARNLKTWEIRSKPLPKHYWNEKVGVVTSGERPNSIVCSLKFRPVPDDDVQFSSEDAKKRHLIPTSHKFFDICLNYLKLYAYEAYDVQPLNIPFKSIKGPVVWIANISDCDVLRDEVSE